MLDLQIELALIFRREGFSGGMKTAEPGETSITKHVVVIISDWNYTVLFSLCYEN